MSEFFASGRAIDLVLLVMLLEGLLLGVLFRRRGIGVVPADLLPMLLAGACLLLALRAALTQAPWPWVAGWVTLALFAHLADLRRRWRLSHHD